MLSVKYVKIHGMKDERWKNRDKLLQIRGVLKLREREIKSQTHAATHEKKEVTRYLKSLKNDVKEFRNVLKDVISGDKRKLQNTLQPYKEILLAYQNLDQMSILEAIFQEVELRRRQLDELCYFKRSKIIKFYSLNKECRFIHNHLSLQEEEPETSSVESNLMARSQETVAKENAAKSIRRVYLAMVNILQKDAVFYDAVLAALSIDKKDQARLILRVTTMGQIVSEKLDDLRTRYKTFAREVWIAMREREKSLGVLRAQVEDIWACAKSFVRAESEVEMRKKKPKETSTEEILQTQITQLESVLDQVKESFLVWSYHELYPRLQKQSEQKERLLKELYDNIHDRDLFLKKKNHALIILASLEHSVVSTTTQYKSEKKSLLEEIKVSQKQENDCKNLRRIRGELLMNIRAVLQTMMSMLVCVKYHGKSLGKKGVHKPPVTGHSEMEEEEEIIETDSIALLAILSKKISALYNMSNFELNKERAERARELYQTYVSDYKSNLIFGKEEPEPSGIFLEPELLDPTVMTRTEVKLHSKQIVNANLKLE